MTPYSQLGTVAVAAKDQKSGNLFIPPTNYVDFFQTMTYCHKGSLGSHRGFKNLRANYHSVLGRSQILLHYRAGNPNKFFDSRFLGRFLTAIRKGQSVTLLCSSFLEDGSCLDEDGPNDPLRMRAGSRGANEFSNTVARALVGMRANESKQLRVPARLAFGESDPKRIYKVPVTPSRSYKIGEEIKLKVNSNSSEEILEGVVVNVEGEFANVDTNHPLAGKSLLLNIKIISFN